jgi:outer membrane protein assembly factor BamE (lipoprotein component of BamABCDE complex)
MLKYVFVIILTLIVGCSHVSDREKYPSLKMNDIKIGMTKQQVIEIMGTPSSTSAINNTMYLNYRIHEWNHPEGQERTSYFVRFIDGKVEAYGKSGDFDSTKPPTVRIEKDETIKQDTNMKIEEKPDLYNELQKLKDLKEQGLLTEEEFELKRKEILKKY